MRGDGSFASLLVVVLVGWVVTLLQKTVRVTFRFGCCVGAKKAFFIGVPVLRGFSFVV